MQETSVRPTAKAPKISYEDAKKLELEPTIPGALVAEQCEDVRDGFDLHLHDGRATVRFGIDEAIKLHFFLSILIKKANETIVAVHKQMMQKPIAETKDGTTVNVLEPEGMVYGEKPKHEEEEVEETSEDIQ